MVATEEHAYVTDALISFAERPRRSAFVRESSKQAQLSYQSEVGSRRAILAIALRSV
jgi:hypothetical protein